MNLVEDQEFGETDKATWMWWIACGGALAGFIVAASLAYITEYGWPLNVGGLPIWAWWPNLIIMFELTMLGAIIATVATLVVTAGLGRGRGTLYDAEVSDGKILVGVEHPAATAVNDLRTALGAPAGAEVKTV